jgi:hypothetical protein
MSPVVFLKLPLRRYYIYFCSQLLVVGLKFLMDQ